MYHHHASALPTTRPDVVLAVEGGAFVRSGQTILADIDWMVRPGERWAVLGPNGAGKSSLLRIASTYEALTRGTTTVLDQQIGHVDVRVLRQQIAVVSAFFQHAIPPRTRALDLVVMGRDAKLMRWKTEYRSEDEAVAQALLERFGCGELTEAAFETLSEGERQRVQLARAMMTAPDLLLLDEPTAGLDLVGREQLVSILGELAASEHPAGIVMVTHHPEEVPPGFTHAVLLRDGRTVVAGPLEETITSTTVSACFGAPLQVRRQDGRFTVRMVR